MKMPASSWCKITSKRQWELWKSLNRDLKPYRFSLETMEEMASKDEWFYVHCMSDSTFGYRDLPKNGERSSLEDLEEYRLPNCGPIPDGWRLVDTDKEPFRTDAKFWVYDRWSSTSNKDHWGVNEYIVPIDGSAHTQPPEKIGESASSVKEVFPVRHYFYATPENIKEFLKRFETVISVSNRVVDLKWLGELSSTAEVGLEDDGRMSRSEKTNWFSRNGYTRFVFEHEKAAEPNQSKDVFPAMHYFKNTPENIKAFLSRFKPVPTNSNGVADGAWFKRLADSAAEFGTDSSGAMGYSMSYWHGDEGYTEFKFDAEESNNPPAPSHNYQVGDKVVIVHNNLEGSHEGYWTKHNIGTVVRIAALDGPTDLKVVTRYDIAHGAIALGSTEPKTAYVQTLHASQVRPATPEEIEADLKRAPLCDCNPGDTIVVTENQAVHGITFRTPLAVGSVLTVDAVCEDAVVASYANGTQTLTKRQIAKPAGHLSQSHWAELSKSLLAKMSQKIEQGMFDPKPPHDSPVLHSKPDWTDAVTSATIAFPKEVTFPWKTLEFREGAGLTQEEVELGLYHLQHTPEGTLVSTVPVSTSERDDVMLTQSERDEVIKAVEAAMAAKGSSGLGGRAASSVASIAKGALSWLLAPAKPVGRLTLKMLQYLAFLAVVVGGGSYVAYQAYQNGGKYIPEIRWPSEEASPSDEMPKQIHLTSVISG